ncbi:glycosyltransferase family 2 protein [Methanolobus sp.]|uniref:glycosyltransferase family 2 protein n=1 Tax=Methanolobus sp. TaxID=1874737 RepID=UPI0025CF1880|nr:glycosyltransferase family 2 protein [Methanolobus sp.]
MKEEEEEEIMVSICCLAYNHEKFIADAIEGFLMQEVNFKYEILINDDASKDGTADIIRSYEQKYPDLIKPIYQTVNQYSQGKKVSLFNRQRAKGKYIATCEGDDYWTDPKKLQIQFDCLENNPDVVCCYHGDIVLNENGLMKESRIAPEHQRSYTSYEMMTGQVHISTLTIFYRNLDILLKEYPPESFFIKNGDTFLFSILGQYGSGMYLPNIEPAVYRVHEGGIWSMKKRAEQKAMTMNTWFWMIEYYSRLGNTEIEDQFRMRYIIGSMADVPPIRLIKIFSKIVITYVVSSFKKISKKNDSSEILY